MNMEFLPERSIDRLREVKELREQMRMEANLTAVDIRGFRAEIDRLKQLLAKKLLYKSFLARTCSTVRFVGTGHSSPLASKEIFTDQLLACRIQEASAEETEEAQKIKIKNLARDLALL